jgi:hypothetical protein
VLERRPRALIGFAKLFRMALFGGDMVALRRALIDRAAAEPDDANTLWDLALVLQLTGDRAVALQVQAQALRMQQVFHGPGPARPRLRLLAVMGPGDLMANTPIECLLEESDIALDMVYATPDRTLPVSLPEHDVLMVCIGENDDNRALLARVAAELQAWRRPVVNLAERVLWVSREGVSARLHGAPGIAMPITVRVPRTLFEEVGEGRRPLSSLLADRAFPIIARPAGSHAGHGLAKIDHASDIAAYLAAHAGVEFCLTPFVDYRGADGLFRKYRIALIDGRPYLSHMAISDHWMIHYANAGMAHSAEKRAEEAQVMEAFDKDFARRHATAFRAIADRIRLDYFCVDCGETPDGRLLVFEADNSMVVHAMDPVDLYPYKLPQMQKLFAAFRDMLMRRSAAFVPVSVRRC